MGLRDGDDIHYTIKNKEDDFNEGFVCLLFVCVALGVKLRASHILETRQAIYH